MRALLQRVSEASVTIDKKVSGEIGSGFLILLGIEREDDETDIDWLVKKIIGMRIFENEEGKMNLSIRETGAYKMVFLRTIARRSCSSNVLSSSSSVNTCMAPLPSVQTPRPHESYSREARAVSLWCVKTIKKIMMGHHAISRSKISHSPPQRRPAARGSRRRPLSARRWGR